jgi:hypothetical protein
VCSSDLASPRTNVPALAASIVVLNWLPVALIAVPR